MNKFFALVLAGTLSAAAIADEHGPATLKGEAIELFEHDHAFAGKVNEFPLYAGFDHQPFGTTFVLRKNDKTLQTRIETPAPREGLDSKLYGELVEQVNAEQSVTTTVSLKSIQRNEDQSALYTFEVDAQKVTVLVKGESFENNHFIAPSFEATLANGEALNWKFSGQSCFGYSANIAASLLLAHTHLKK